ncbi:MAG: 1-deoxy-D-xylulose-5-phosphate reductoisomerase [Pseudomonadota bacterium]
MRHLFPFSDVILPNGGDITILGSTGSIGVNCLNIIRKMESQKRHFHLKSLIAGTNYRLLAEQADMFRPDAIALYDDRHYLDLKKALSAFEGKILCGFEGVMELASQRSDYVMSAIVGTAGLQPTAASAQKGTIIALANKECVVSGGKAFLQHIAEAGAKIFPVDSEHHALFQLMSHMPRHDIHKYYITASGGPFLNTPLEDFENITPQQAVAHPNWDMGAKISVDSATMMNKGLELIEAALLFDLDAEACDAVIHPQSLVHGMISNHQGEIHMLASHPDMQIPIWSSLNYGHATKMNSVFDPLDPFHMSFMPIDKARYPAFFLAKDVLQRGGDAPAIMNAANEVAVERFLAKDITFTDISRLTAHVVEKCDKERLGESKPSFNVNEILERDRAARDAAHNWIEAGCRHYA